MISGPFFVTDVSPESDGSRHERNLAAATLTKAGSDEMAGREQDSGESLRTGFYECGAPAYLVPAGISFQMSR